MITLTLTALKYELFIFYLFIAVVGVDRHIIMISVKRYISNIFILGIFE